MLDDAGGDAGKSGEEEEGDFLAKEGKEIFDCEWLSFDLEAPQRPVIEEEQDEGQRDEHRFAHKSESEEEEGRQKAKG